MQPTFAEAHFHSITTECQNRFLKSPFDIVLEREVVSLAYDVIRDYCLSRSPESLYKMQTVFSERILGDSSLSEVGETLGLSRQRVWQIERRIICVLKNQIAGEIV